MPFTQILGQATAVETLTRALTHDLVHHAYRFEGSAGVGKEMTALAFAQALVCGEAQLGCGRCDACRRAITFSSEPPVVPLHPDVILIGKGLYPEEVIGKRETNEISVEQIRRLVLARSAYAPHEGRARVFIVRNADKLSIGAANALLKTLEEPVPQTHFVLLTAQSERLLDTIRSRSLPVRFGPLSDAVLTQILTQAEVPPARIEPAVALAGGSAAAALAAADAEANEHREQFVSQVLAAIDAPDLYDAVALGEGLDRDRAALVDDLRALAATFVRRARSAARTSPAAAERAAIRHGIVLDAIDSVERNGAAALAVASMIGSLREGATLRPGKKPPIVQQRRA